MDVNIVVPSLGESVSEATIAKWHKKPGDAVIVDELLLELETEKVTLEVSSPASGILSEVLKQQDATVAVAEVVGRIKEGVVAAVAAAIPSKPTIQQPQNITDTTVLSPAVQKLVTENKIDTTNIEGSGKGGRITKGDVLEALSAPSVTQHTVTQSAKTTDPTRQERVKMSRLRKTIAQRLKDSQNTAAILTTFNEIDMSNVISLRQKYREEFEKKHAVKLGFMSFFVKATIDALKAVPAVNAEIDGDEIIYKNYYDIAIAVGTEQGLVVPVVRDSDKLTFAEVEKAIGLLSKKAREGKLTMADLSGGTFSISNGGVYGSLLSTPIINPPQSGILGLHKTQDRPVVVAGRVEVRQMMYIALSYDHRIIDGKEAVTFLIKVKEAIENPERLLLNL